MTEEAIKKELDRLRDILRTSNDQLEIRMSFNDLHIKKCISSIELKRVKYPKQIVSECSALMFQELMAMAGWVMVKEIRKENGNEK
jgi:hypothetical protein